MAHQPKQIPERLEFVVTGCCRSGTGYMSALFRSLGYPIGHEQVEEFGISSWCWAVKNSAPKNCGVARPEYTIPQHTVYVVREPWAVISSIVSTTLPNSAIRRWARDFIPLNGQTTLIRAAEMVVGWNRLVAKVPPSLTVKAEEAAKVVPEWLVGRGYQLPQNIAFPPTTTNTRPYSMELPLCMADGLPIGLIDDLDNHAAKYGYPLISSRIPRVF